MMFGFSTLSLLLSDSRSYTCKESWNLSEASSIVRLEVYYHYIHHRSQMPMIGTSSIELVVRKQELIEMEPLTTASIELIGLLVDQ